MGETGLAHETDGHDAPCDTDIDTRVLQLLGGFLGVVGQDLRNGMSVVVAARIGFLPERLNLFELVASQFVNFLVECQGDLYWLRARTGESARDMRISDYNGAFLLRSVTPGG